MKSWMWFFLIFGTLLLVIGLSALPRAIGWIDLVLATADFVWAYFEYKAIKR